MMAADCPNEKELLRAARSGEWSADIAVHLVECSDCADLALVGGMLQAAEGPVDSVVDLKQARMIWARADGERRRRRETWALMPVMVAELAACLVGGVALLAMAVNFVSPLSEDMGVAVQRLLADPVVVWLAPVATVLLVGAAAVSLVLAIGFRAVRS